MFNAHSMVIIGSDVEHATATVALTRGGYRGEV